jgi:protein-L-isoaspartate(D-aspartate) O-methyltransferase
MENSLINKTHSPEVASDFDKAREMMVQTQLIPRGIRDERVLSAMRKVPRHLFVPDYLQEEVYGDYPLPIGEGQTISQPYMVALMTQCLELKGPEKVLEIGTGSGYQTAILAELAEKVYSIERIELLASGARKVLVELGYKNIFIRVGDGTLGWPEEAPFDRIMVTAGAPKIPFSLTEQLPEGGKLAIPVGSSFSQTLTVVEKKGGKLETREICSCVFVPLLGIHGWGE